MNEREFHDAHYAAESALLATPLFRRVHARAARQFLRATRAGRTQRVLSLGCGDGSIERLLAPHVGEIVGLDISPVAIGQARARSAGLANLSFRVVEGSLPEGFDVVAAFAFLHHLDDAALRDTLRAARKALRPGGLFYSSDPSTRRLVGRLRWLVRAAYQRHHSPDERELEPRALAALLAEAGFAPPALGYTDYFLGPLAWLAPGTPAWLGAPLEALDTLALRLPLVRGAASSFSLCASSTSSSVRS
jgi:SAM-dependent methyltransferase